MTMFQALNIKDALRPAFASSVRRGFRDGGSTAVTHPSDAAMGEKLRDDMAHPALEHQGRAHHSFGPLSAFEPVDMAGLECEAVAVAVVEQHPRFGCRGAATKAAHQRLREGHDVGPIGPPPARLVVPTVWRGRMGKAPTRAAAIFAR